jgi:hypothetical protein
MPFLQDLRPNLADVTNVFMVLSMQPLHINLPPPIPAGYPGQAPGGHPLSQGGGALVYVSLLLTPCPMFGPLVAPRAGAGPCRCPHGPLWLGRSFS